MPGPIGIAVAFELLLTFAINERYPRLNGGLTKKLNMLGTNARSADSHSHARSPRVIGYSQSTGSVRAYHASTWSAKAASMRFRLIFSVGVRKPLSMLHGSRATTIMRKRS